MEDVAAYKKLMAIKPRPTVEKNNDISVNGLLPKLSTMNKPHIVPVKLKKDVTTASHMAVVMSKPANFNIVAE